MRRIISLWVLFSIVALGCSAMKEQRVATLPPNKKVESMITNRLKNDPLTAAWDIRPDVEGESVVLTGLVDREEERRRAEDLTRSVVGELRRVDNRIMLTREVILDNSITSALKNGLISDPLTRTANIEVRSHKGVVTLQGTVASNEQKAQAEALAREITGVAHVENQIKVSG